MLQMIEQQESRRLWQTVIEDISDSMVPYAHVGIAVDDTAEEECNETGREGTKADDILRQVCVDRRGKG